MLTRRLLFLISIVWITCTLPMLTGHLLVAQDSLTVFSDTTSVLSSTTDSLQTLPGADDWITDDLPEWSTPFVSDILSMLMCAVGLTSILAVFIILIIILFPLIAIIAIIVLVYKLNKQKNRTNEPQKQPEHSSKRDLPSRQYLKDQAINSFMWAVALLLLYWLLGWTILAIGGIIFLCIAGSQIWRFKSGQDDHPDAKQTMDEQANVPPSSNDSSDNKANE